MTRKRYRKTSEEEFALFGQECLRMQKKLSLLGWSLYFSLKRHDDSYAQIDDDGESNVINISLCDRYDPSMPFDVVKIAQHEMWHVFLRGIVRLGKSRFVGEHQFYDLEENLVTVLEGLDV